jgi:rhodanese-related sulfurtransferase
VSDATGLHGNPPAPAADSLSPAAVWELYRQHSVRLVDVRTPPEFARAHAQGAVSVPLDRLDPKALVDGSPEPVYLICRAGSRSREAYERIRSAVPDARVRVVDGGTLAWRDAGLPMVYGPRPRRRPPRWQQVTVLGVLAASVLLAVFVHKGLLGIAGLLGAWLAGVVLLHPRKWRQSPTAGSPG